MLRISSQVGDDNAELSCTSTTVPSYGSLSAFRTSLPHYLRLSLTILSIMSAWFSSASYI